MDKTETHFNDDASDWYNFGRNYSYVKTKPTGIGYYLGCIDLSGDYRTVCHVRSSPKHRIIMKSWFKIKVFAFKLTHPNWQFK
jgi:hypothetical protein